MREVFEETGLHISPDSLQLVALFEAAVVAQSKQWLMVCYAGMIQDQDVKAALRIQEAEVNSMGLFPSHLVDHLKPGGKASAVGEASFPGCALVKESEVEADSCLGNGGVERVTIKAADVVEGMGAGHKYALSQWLQLKD